MNYDYVQKHHWRNRLWNEFERRVKCRTSDAVVLYLAAETDFDRDVALRKGFRAENLIAVERDADVVRLLRDRGTLCIQGDLLDVLLFWPTTCPVHAVFGDFVCGLTPAIIKAFRNAYSRRVFKNAIFAANLLRGRDASTNSFREIAIDHYKLCSKHRGIILQKLSWLHAWGLTHDRYKNEGHGDLADQFVTALSKLDEIPVAMDVRSDCYRSTSGQTFDWVVWNNPVGEFVPNLLYEEAVEDALMKSLRSDIGKEMGHRISACLAHRTRRLQAA